jgi:sugar phosphate isomerase/epimerase
MKFALSIQTPEVERILPLALLSGSFEEKCQRAAEYGANGIELITTDPDALDLTKISSTLKQNRLLPAAIASGGMASTKGLTLLNPDPIKAEAAYRKLESLILFAGALGAPVVTIGSFRGRMNVENGLSQEQFAELLHRAGDRARMNSTRLALEPLNRYETDFLYNTRQGLDFLELVNHPSVGLLIDTFHANIEESSRTKHFLEALDSQKLFHVHIADNNRLSPGSGLIEFGEIFRVLDQNGYEGFISAELLPKPDPDMAAHHTLSYIQKILERQ